MPDGTIPIRPASGRMTNVRWLIVAMLFVVTTVNYADRATIAIAGPVISKDLGLNAAQMGVVFSAFGWAYVIAQLPGGWLLDRYGSKKRVCREPGALVAVHHRPGFCRLRHWRFCRGGAVRVAFHARGGRIPFVPRQQSRGGSLVSEPGTGNCLRHFQLGPIFATVLFAPLMGWITYEFGWPWVFGVMGGLGIILTVAWLRLVYSPVDHPMATAPRLTTSPRAVDW